PIVFTLQFTAVTKIIHEPNMLSTPTPHMVTGEEPSTTTQSSFTITSAWHMTRGKEPTNNRSRGIATKIKKYICKEDVPRFLFQHHGVFLNITHRGHLRDRNNRQKKRRHCTARHAKSVEYWNNLDQNIETAVILVVVVAVVFTLDIGPFSLPSTFICPYQSNT
ncbi:unnamed protein product, partial [Ectocarpus sp. 12 AP-2014]